ncbi:hypothetical protein [Streptomyces griseoluteus]
MRRAAAVLRRRTVSHPASRPSAARSRADDSSQAVNGATATNQTSYSSQVTPRTLSPSGDIVTNSGWPAVGPSGPARSHRSVSRTLVQHVQP